MSFRKIYYSGAPNVSEKLCEKTVCMVYNKMHCDNYTPRPRITNYFYQNVLS